MARAPLVPVVARRCLCAGGPTEVPIPELGAESIVEGSILSIAKKAGDYVAAEEMVAEMEVGETWVGARAEHLVVMVTVAACVLSGGGSSAPPLHLGIILGR